MTSPSYPRYGFTLLELLAVVAILALAASVVGTSLSGRGRVRLKQAEEALLYADQWTRQLVEQRGEPVRLRIRLNDNSYFIHSLEKSDQQAERLIDIPYSIKIVRAMTPQEDRTAGEVVIDFNRQGSSPTYAIELESSHGESKWIVFAGGSGQSFVFSDSNRPTSDSQLNTYREADVEKLFRSLQEQRFHAD